MLLFLNCKIYFHCFLILEKGDFLALDLGGTNFRVILLKMDPESELDCIVKYYTVPEPLRLGEGYLASYLTLHVNLNIF